MTVRVRQEERGSGDRARRISSPSFFVILGLALATLLLVHGPRILDPYQVEDDFRLVYWLHQYDSLALFPDDPLLLNSVSTVAIGPWELPVELPSLGYSALFWAGSHFLSPVLLGKLLAIPLTLVAVGYAYAIGRQLGRARGAVTLSLAFLALNLASPTSVSTVAGLHRSFVFPLLLALLYYLLVGRGAAAAAVLVAGALVYPPVFALGSVTYGLLLLLDRRRRWSDGPLALLRKGRPLVVALLLGALILSPFMIARFGPDSSVGAPGEPVGAAATDAGDSESLLKTGRRSQLISSFPLVGRAGLAVPGLSFIHIVVLAILFVFIWALTPGFWRKLPSPLTAFWWAIWICFGLAWLLFLATGSFVIYFPSRYTESGLVLFFLIPVAVHLEPTIPLAARWLRRHRRRLAVPFLLLSLVAVGWLLLTPSAAPPTLRWLLVALLLALPLLSLLGRSDEGRDARPGGSLRQTPFARRALMGLLLLLAGVYVASFYPRFYRATDAERELYAYLETLPADSLIAGDPRTLSNVPIFARRRVAYSCKHFKPEIASMVVQGQEAYYARPGDGRLVANFCTEHGVDVLVVDDESFAAGTMAHNYCSYPPYDRDLAASLAGRESFLLPALAGQEAVFKSGPLSVIPCPPPNLEATP